MKCGEHAARGEGTGNARSRGREKNPRPQAPARGQGRSHSPSPVPDLRHQLLVTFAQGRLLVCAHQASALQEELGQWRARGRGEPAQKRRAAWHWLERAGWRSKRGGGILLPLSQKCLQMTRRRVTWVSPNSHSEGDCTWTQVIRFKGGPQGGP